MAQPEARKVVLLGIGLDQTEEKSLTRQAPSHQGKPLLAALLAQPQFTVTVVARKSSTASFRPEVLS